jgi:hypothetical protein
MKRLASASVYGTGTIGIQRWMSGSWHEAVMSGASSARSGRSATTRRRSRRVGRRQLLSHGPSMATRHEEGGPVRGSRPAKGICAAGATFESLTDRPLSDGTQSLPGPARSCTMEARWQHGLTRDRSNLAQQPLFENVSRRMPMRFALMTEPQQGLTYAEQLNLALLAERLGFEAFYRSDHYRSFPGPADRPTTDAWTVLAGIARETRPSESGRWSRRSRSAIPARWPRSWPPSMK